MSFHFSCIHYSFYFFFNAFPPKITLGPWHGVGVGGVHLSAMPQGQKVTYSGPKCDVRGAEKWRMGQNATMECYNYWLIYASLGLNELKNGRAICLYHWLIHNNREVKRYLMGKDDMRQITTLQEPQTIEVSLKIVPDGQLTVFQHWFKSEIGANQTTSSCLKQWWLVYWLIYASLGLNEL